MAIEKEKQPIRRFWIILWLTIFVTIISVIDGNFFGVNIKPEWASVLESIIVVAYGSYFIAKSYEHGKRYTEERHEYMYRKKYEGDENEGD